MRLREYFRKHEFWFLATCLKSLLQHKYGCEISIHAKISIRAQFMHTVGIVIGEGCIIEDDVILYSNVVLGRKSIYEASYPIIRRGVTLCTGSTILGNITIGEHTVIGANSLVMTDCKPNSVYVGSPSRKIK